MKAGKFGSLRNKQNVGKNSPQEQRNTEPDSYEPEEYDTQEPGRTPTVYIPQEKVRPVRLHPTVRDLISLAAGNTRIQHALVDRVEELQEPISLLSGGPILQRILEKLPTPGDATAWASPCASLPPEQAAALKKLSNEPVELQDAEAVAEMACARAARDAVEARIDILKAQINRGNLSNEEFYRLSTEMTELRRMLNES